MPESATSSNDSVDQGQAVEERQLNGTHTQVNNFIADNDGVTHPPHHNERKASVRFVDTEAAGLSEAEEEAYVESLKRPPTPPLHHDEPDYKGVVVMLFLVASAGCGFLFGWAMEKGRVFEPASIRLQMVFERFIMLKMFLAAMASGMLVISVLHLVPYRPLQSQIRAAVSSTQSVMLGKNLLSLTIGPAVMGVGMTLAGACPGMMFPQLGAWATNAYLTVIGGFIGNLLYGLWHDRLYAKLFPKEKLALPAKYTRLPQSEPWHFVCWSAPLIVCVLAVLAVLEYVVPWHTELTRPGAAGYDLTSHAWPPILCGCMIGCLQGCLLLFGHTLSGSGAFNTLCAHLMLSQTLRQKFPYLGNKRKFTGESFWQLIFVVCSTLGGLASALASNSLATVDGVPWPYALVGGILLLLGARIACGCTSGHGLSGCSLLFVGSFIAVPCMFAGGIASAFIMKAAGVLDQWA